MYLQILVFLLSYLLTLNAVFAQGELGHITSVTCPKDFFSLERERDGKLHLEEIKLHDALFANDVLQVKKESCTMTIVIDGKEIKLGGGTSQRLRYVVIEKKGGPPTIVKMMFEFFEVWQEAVFGPPPTSVGAGSERGAGKITIPVFGIIENEGEMAILIENKKQLFLNWKGDLSPYRVRIKNNRGRPLCATDETYLQKVVLSFSQPMFKAGNSYWIEVESRDQECKKRTKAADDCKDKGKFRAVKEDTLLKNQLPIDNLIKFAEDNEFKWLFEAYQQMATLKKKNPDTIPCRKSKSG
jgi:hypothetical protein